MQCHLCAFFLPGSFFPSYLFISSSEAHLDPKLRRPKETCSTKTENRTKFIFENKLDRQPNWIGNALIGRFRECCDNHRLANEKGTTHVLSVCISKLCDFAANVLIQLLFFVIFGQLLILRHLSCNMEMNPPPLGRIPCLPVKLSNTSTQVPLLVVPPDTPFHCETTLSEDASITFHVPRLDQTDTCL